MKIVQYERDGVEKTGLLEDNLVTELSCSTIEAINSSSTKRFEKHLIYKIADIKIKSPVSSSKIVCVGLNYRDHAAELKMELPEEPIIFLKPSTAVIGHLDNVIYPNSSKQLDYEAEIGIIIQKVAKDVKKNDAEEFIGGYTVINDVTARDLQQKDGQWTRAKSFDTFAPQAPVLKLNQIQ